MRPAEHALLRTLNKQYREYLVAGERLLTVDPTIGDLSDYWFATTLGVFIIAAPTTANYKLDEWRWRHLPYDWIDAVDEKIQGALVVRTLRLKSEAPMEEVEITGWFGAGPSAFVSTVRKNIAEAG